MKMQSTIIAVLALISPLTTFGEAKPKPMKIFVFAGQSNMTGMSRTSTLEHIKMVPETAADFADLFDKDGKPVALDDLYVSQWMEKQSGRLEPIYGGGEGDCFGPEYACGICLHKKLKEPFLIIKTSLGGFSLSYRYRSPSSDKWTPPPGHPDLATSENVEAKAPALPLPDKIDLTANWTPDKPHALRKRHLGFDGFKGAEIGRVGSINPIYILSAAKGKIKGDPFQQGDLILEEEEIPKIAISDGDFHYLGSGKIMAGIGRGFAEALLQTLAK